MNDTLDRYIEGVKNLPMAPTVLIRLVALFQTPDREVDEIVELMRQDPSLTAEVLRHSNSSYFGHEEPVVDVFEAITRMGFYEVYKTAVARLGSQTLRAPQSAGGIDVEKLWRHSAITAVTASLIARKVQENEGLAFTAGLLHDVGKMVLSAAEGGVYAMLTKKAGEEGSSLPRMEAMLFGFGHAEIGAKLLDRWGLPEEITVPVSLHHQIDWPKPHDRICAVVSLGNIMAHAAEDDLPGNPYAAPEAVCALMALELGQTDVADLLADAQNDIKRMTALLDVEAK
jgi:putative nucleotidyltransferase with HDIG domain